LEYKYTEIKEEKRYRGCVFSRIYIRYPETVGSECLDALFRDEALGFYTFLIEKATARDEEDFSEYLKNGGRRSAFIPTEYSLKITVVSDAGGILCIKTEVLSSKDGTVTANKSFSEYFETRTGAPIRRRKAERKKICLKTL
jgi:vacuolar-type H+-ATPase subunit E/Vma4